MTVADPDVEGGRRVEVAVDVAPRVDDDRDPGDLVDDERREMAEPVEENRRMSMARA